MEISKYEIEALNIMLDSTFSKEEINSIVKSPITGYEFTGAGYFLEITHNKLPTNRIVVSEPMLLGRAEEFNVGFLIFIENSKLVLECHSWGIENPPESIREKSIEIIKLNQNKLKLNGVYPIKSLTNVHIVEFEAKEQISDLEISQITQVVEGEERLNWQSPYDEKYLNTANEVIGDWMDEPSLIKIGEKVVFFFHELNLDKPLRTQYGNFEISESNESPNWMDEIMKYEAP